MMITNASSVGFDKLSAAYASNPSTGTSALKGALNTQILQQAELSEMMREATPHLGQNVDMEA